MNLLRVTVFISIACLTTDLVSGAKKKETKKRLSALETAVDQLNDGLEEINSTVQEIKEVAQAADYECYNYSPLELGFISSGAFSEKWACEHDPTRKFTRGVNANYRGCGSCWCCKGMAECSGTNPVPNVLETANHASTAARPCNLYPGLYREVQPKWDCYSYNAEEQAEIAKGNSESVCNSDLSRKFTKGNNANYPGCGSCLCCKESWKCYHYSPLEMRALAEGRTGQQICEHAGDREFTGGVNGQHPGCDTCWCCARDQDMAV